ncbi:MAG: SPFH domain-containing protein, partial [Desulfobacterales bacterium]|nr:SPFH domain-containing protein [Desulfobacterales bacterium]
MDFGILLASIIFGFLGVYIFSKSFKKIVLKEYESGLLYKNGKFKKLLGAGRYWTNGWTTEITRVDGRLKTDTIPGQEVLTQDQVGLKISIGIQYQIENPEKAFHISESYFNDLYQTSQLALRSIVGNQKIEDLLENRTAIGTALLEMVTSDAEKIGLKIHRIDIK